MVMSVQLILSSKYKNIVFESNLYIQKKSQISMADTKPQAKKDEKKNTDAWKLKQEEKKKLKETQEKLQSTEEAESKKVDNKKDKVAKTKKQTKKQEKQPQSKPIQTTQTKLSEDPAITYKAILKIDDKLSKQQRVSRGYQQELVFKYLDQYITKSDTVLYVGDQNWTPSCQQVYVDGFNNCPQAELACHYQDVSYFLESTITKIFIKADYLFANGSLLAKKGALNIVFLGEYYNIPIVASGGSWSYNGWSPLSEAALIDKYGPELLQKYDWIDSKYLKATVLQVGGVNPKQVSIYPPLIYKDLNLASILW